MTNAPDTSKPPRGHGAPRRIVIAPDSFKGSISAAGAAAAIATGWRRQRPDDEIVLAPMADGGEGTGAAIEAAVQGVRRIEIPGGTASWWLVPWSDGSRAALVELAQTSGLTVLATPAPMDAHTHAFGEAIRAALAAGADRLLLAIGGSASTDGGAGALRALGVALVDAGRHPIPLGAHGLSELGSVDWSGAVVLPREGALILSDVDNPLLGPRGSVAVFGPQKGITPELAGAAEAGLARLAARMVENPGGASPDDAGAGAAGGTGFGLLAWGARMGAGARVVAETIGLPEAIADADLVITGEGRFDAQTAGGKVAAEVARLASDSGVPCALIAGVIAAAPDGFESGIALAELAGSAAASLAEPSRWLEVAGSMLARD